ncbi:Eco57I restriction-modification methylase domain-containing protein, partial [Thiolapillus sp.]
MAELDKEARRKLELPELIADALVGEVLAAGGKEVDTAALAIKVGQAIEGNAEAIDALRRKTRTRLSTDLPSGKAPRHPMHWPLEFPEVFVRDNGGFDAIVGNPPFLGNRLWKNSQGRALQVIVQMVLGAAPGKIDLCVAFHRRATDLLLMGGEYGLLATSNLAEGSAIEVGLREIVKQGDIHFSRKGMPWPGKAAVVVAIVCFHKGEWHGVRDADGKGCERIGPRLECEMADAWRPKPLENTIFAFAGVNNSKGLAFVVTPDDIWFERLRSERDSLLRPYITGNDITSHALNRRNRWVLDVGDQDLEAILKRWPIAYQFLNKVVRPTRTPEALKSYKGLYERWWQFWNHRADLMRRLRQRDRFIAFSKVTKYPICMLAPSDWIYTNQVVLIGVDREDLYPICL